MNVEHITAITNHLLIRATEGIEPTTERHFRPFSRLGAGQHTIDIERTPFTCRVTVSLEGAMFDMFLRDTEAMLYSNVCCFGEVHSDLLMGHVELLGSGLPLAKGWQPRKPLTGHWLYSIPIAPWLGTPEQGQLAGEIEFYIWNALRKAVHNLH